MHGRPDGMSSSVPLMLLENARSNPGCSLCLANCAERAWCGTPSHLHDRAFMRCLRLHVQILVQPGSRRSNPEALLQPIGWQDAWTRCSDG
eukprot:351308-Chlamydomonas_euryale.AAC.6